MTKKYRCVVDNKEFYNFEEYDDHFCINIQKNYSAEELLEVLNKYHFKNYLEIISLKKKIENLILNEIDISKKELNILKALKLLEIHKIKKRETPDVHYNLTKIIKQKNKNLEEGIKKEQLRHNRVLLTELEELLNKKVMETEL